MNEKKRKARKQAYRDSIIEDRVTFGKTRKRLFRQYKEEFKKRTGVSNE